MNFGEALELLKVGKLLQRKGWNGKGMFLGLSQPNEEGKTPFKSYINGMACPIPTLPFIVMKTATGELVPWLASQTDMLAEDWQEFAE